MRNLSLWVLALLLVPVLVLTGIGCGQDEEVEEETETESEQSELLEEAGIEEDAGWEASVPGYWTMTIQADEGQIEVNAVYFDDNTLQGLYGMVYSEAGAQRVEYSANSYGNWEVNGSVLTVSGGSIQPFTGTIIDETHWSGQITDNAGVTAPWTAVKTRDLDRLLEVPGSWMLEFEIAGQQRFERLECAPNGLCEVVWEKYQGGYEGEPGSERFYTWHHQGGYDLGLESTDGSLSHDLDAEWNDDWGGWEVDGSYTTDDGSGDSGGIKMGE